MSVVGENAVVSAREITKGGLLMRSLTGDFFRVWETKPQVQLSGIGFHHNLSVKCLLWSLLITLYFVCLLTINPVEQVLFVFVALHKGAVFVPPGRM